MLRTKFIIIAALLIFLISVGSAVIETLSEPNSNGKNLDSYGTEFYGMRGMYDTAQMLNLPVARNFTPPDSLPENTATVFLCSPSATLIYLEPKYIHSLKEWVAKEGGRLVIAPNRHGNTSALKKDKNQKFDNILALPGIRTSYITKQKETKEELENPEDIPQGSEKEENNSYKVKLEKALMQNELYKEIKILKLSPNKKNDIFNDVDELALPANFRYITNFGKRKPKYVFSLFNKNGTSYPFTAIFSYGKGEIIYVADPSVFFNRFYFNADNAVFAMRLLYPDKKPMVIDEFYHGLNIKGKPFWLLTRMPYTFITMLMLATICVWILRSSVRLGPPVKLIAENRRSLHEYISAMSRVFARADARKYILQEAYEGILWHIRRDLKLPPKCQNPYDLSRIIARNDPERAARLLGISEKIETILTLRHIKKNDAINLIREINQCL